MKLTKNQIRAITSNASLLAVRAGAGSGKTTVLVDRYIRLVLDVQISPHKILAATFTEKAAAEMKERVAEAFLKHNRPDYVAELNAAPICTLHSFCSRLIAPKALELGIDPGYRVLEQSEADLLQEETLAEVFIRWHRDHPDDIRRLVNLVAWSDDYGMRRGRTPSSRGFSRHFLNLVLAARSAGKGDSAPFKPIEIDPVQLEAQCKNIIKKLDALGHLAEKSAEKADRAIDYLKRYLRIRNNRDRDTYETVYALSKIPQKGAHPLVKLLKEIRKTLFPLLKDDLFSDRYQEAVTVLSHLYRDFLDAYRAKKATLGALDFLDLEETALRVLADNPDWQPVERVLIDEAQDLNSVQWKLIRRLSEKAPLFAVGDAQQSIYGFRHAAVEIFEQFVRDAEKQHPQNVISLADNFRSRKSVLSVVNRIFQRTWANTDVSFLELRAETPYPEYDKDPVELLIAWESDRRKARQREADHLARRIYDLVKGGDFQLYEKRKIEEVEEPGFEARQPDWKDVRVLVRSRSSFEYLERAFNRYGIPFVVQAGRGFWDELEISDLMALLRSLEDPGDDFSLACLLKSPAVGFDDNDIMELRVIHSPGDKEGMKVRPLYEGLRLTADINGEEGGLPHSAARFLKLFEALYHRKDRFPLRSLLETWIAETGLEKYWAHHKYGDLIRSNVRKFLRLCDAQAGQPITRLRAAFDQIRLRDLQEGIAPIPQSDEGAVQMMTVHAAKGLEAPIVALFDMNYESKSNAASFVYSRCEGAAFKLTNAFQSEDAFTPTLFCEINNDLKMFSEEENQRVLYVAMTRAQEKLLLSASCTLKENGKGRISGWLKLFSAQLGLDLDAFLDQADLSDDAVPLINREGVNTGILLRRCHPKADLPLPTLAERSRPVPAIAVPASFPTPYEETQTAVSVTEWIRDVHQCTPVEENPEDEPDNDETGKTGRGASMGRWVHRLLEIVPLDASQEDVKQLAEKEARHLFGKPADDVVQSDAVQMAVNFLSSPLAEDVRRAAIVFREYPLLCQRGKHILKGKLDLIYRLKNGWHLVDFKSDHFVPHDGDPVRFYALQMQTYALMWEQLTGELPRNAWLFYLRSAQSHTISLSDEALQDIRAGMSLL